MTAHLLLMEIRINSARRDNSLLKGPEIDPQPAIALGARRFWTISPIVEAASGNTQQPAHDVNRVDHFVCSDALKGALHRTTSGPRSTPQSASPRSFC